MNESIALKLDFWRRVLLCNQTASTNALFQCKSCFQIWFWTKSFTAKPNCANKSFVSNSKCLNVNVALKPNFNFWRTFLPWNQTMPTEALFWILCNPQKVRIKFKITMSEQKVWRQVLLSIRASLFREVTLVNECSRICLWAVVWAPLFHEVTQANILGILTWYTQMSVLHIYEIKTKWGGLWGRKLPQSSQTLVSYFF